MALSGTPAVFFLSPLGQQALAPWIGERTSFPVLMVSSDAVGAWISLAPISPDRQAATEPVMLVKWDYVATVTFEVSSEGVPARAPIGFRPRREP